MSYQEVRPASVVPAVPTKRNPEAAVFAEPVRASRVCLTGSSGLRLRNALIVTAAYIAFAVFGALVFALVNVSWFMLIPLLGGLAASLVVVYFLNKQHKQTQVQSQPQYPQHSQQMLVPMIHAEFYCDQPEEQKVEGIIDALRKSLYREKR